MNIRLPNLRTLLRIGLLILLATSSAAWAEAPREWIDPSTGHRIVRLSDEPGSASLYFNINGYTPQGDKLIITTPTGIASVDLKTRKLHKILSGDVNVLFAGRKTRQVYYVPGKHEHGQPYEVWAVDVDSGKTHRVVRVERGEIMSINADETLLAGVYATRDYTLQPKHTTSNYAKRYEQADYSALGPDGKPLPFAEAKEVRLDQRLEAKIPMEIFTLDIATGKRHVVTQSTDWLNHVQFSPTDPTLLMYCHEGPWHKVDRIWTIHTDGSDMKKIHARTMNMEIAGHEFFSPDGKTIWYDLQTPRGEDFWLAGYEIATGHRTWYHLQRNEWSVHYNVSRDGKLFAGDGGDAQMVAHAPDGKWLYLFHPQAIPDVAGIHAPDSASLITPGYFKAEKLVNLSKHDYRLEPNVHFSPDGKWIIFRSNMYGPKQVYAVEIAKAKPGQE
ncbi:oligogalacturonate lyase family protein [Solimonas marina]|uniref:Oligogalacturonate lyase n=1 Tax=Solimonas marina TaxID=2714601 RepID=A0A969WCM4_9GAMM|nr:oligogalacturonate lyase family protein [Solimonas marina]NKF24103.1 oligogalacturonate lyase [Solimonas marina]